MTAPNKTWPDGRVRCHWANPKNEKYIHYHDTEWGVPTYDDAKLFEMLVLETFQAGLSWECILNRRDAFRRAFDNFDIARVCNYDTAKLAQLQNDTGIIRNARKISAVVNNARVFTSIAHEYGTFSKYLWHWTRGRIIHQVGKTRSALSDKIAADLRAQRPFMHTCNRRASLIHTKINAFYSANKQLIIFASKGSDASAAFWGGVVRECVIIHLLPLVIASEARRSSK